MGTRRTFFPAPPNFLPLWELERPVDWSRRFGRAAPLAVEIGVGTGENLVREARSRPDWNFLGLELKWGRLARALHRAEEAGLPNVLGLLADARFVFHRLLPERSVRQVVALFLDPWPKDRHEKRRLFGRDFLRLAASRLEDGGCVYLVTDHAPFAGWVEEQAVGTGLSARRRPVGPGFGTRFEAKWLGTGRRTFWEVRFEKREHPQVPAPEEAEVIAYAVDGFDPRRFRPEPVRGGVTVAFKQFLYDPDKRWGMVRAVVVEPNLTQQLWIEIVHDRKGWRVSPAEGCVFVPTPGVRAALEAVREAARRSVEGA